MNDPSSPVLIPVNALHRGPEPYLVVNSPFTSVLSEVRVYLVRRYIPILRHSFVRYRFVSILIRSDSVVRKQSRKYSRCTPCSSERFFRLEHRQVYARVHLKVPKMESGETRQFCLCCPEILAEAFQFYVLAVRIPYQPEGSRVRYASVWNTICSKAHLHR